jgi:hypothetical protein
MRAPALPYASDYATDPALARARAAYLLSWIADNRRAGANLPTLRAYLLGARQYRQTATFLARLPV